MATPIVSKDIALRIGLAARVLPDTEPKALLSILDDAIGLPPSPAKLKALTVKQIKAANDGALSETPMASLKEAVAYLRGDVEIDIDDDSLPKAEAYADGDMPESIRVAIASNSGEALDGHFGSCQRFLVYQVSAIEARLIDVRNLSRHLEDGVDKNDYRADTIKDCQVAYLVSVGGPAAAKVVRRDIHPIKMPNGGDAREIVGRLSATLATNPPPWLAKVMGVGAEDRVRFEREDEDA